MEAKIEEIENYAKKNNIPIMLKDGIEFLCNYIKEKNYKNILEIGSAIAYSAIRMALVDKDIHITTIERDKKRYEEAVRNISKFNLENQITILNVDALDIDLDDTFDFIFIDAAKSGYIKYFNKFDKNLLKGGSILSDNLDFHGLTHTTDFIPSRNVRGIVRKLNDYINFLKENENYDTSFYEIGDGISISVKKVD